MQASLYLDKMTIKGPPFGWNELILHPYLVLLVDTMDGSVRLLSKLAPVIGVCEAFHSRKNSQRFFQQQVRHLRCITGRETNGKLHLQR